LRRVGVGGGVLRGVVVDGLGGGGRGSNEAKVDQTTEMHFFCLIRVFRKVAIHDKL